MKDSQLKQITHADKIKQMIANAKKRESQLVAWRLVDGKKALMNVRLRVLKDFKGEMVLAVSEEDSSLFKDMLVNSETVNFFFKEDYYLFQSKIKSKKFFENEFVVHYPKMIAHVDRRDFLRCNVEDLSIKAFFEMKYNNITQGQKIFKKNCLDLSEMGTAIAVMRSEKDYFEKGKIIPGLLLELEGKNIPLICEVVNISPIQDGDKYKVSLKFKNAARDVRSYLCDYVLKNLNFEQEVS